MKVEYLASGAPDTPLLRIYGTDRVAFASLRDAAARLIAIPGRHVALDALPGFESPSDCAVLLVSGRRSEGVRAVGPACFRWELTPTDWTTIEGLIEPFLLDQQPGAHQWLAGRQAAFGFGRSPVAVVLSASADGSW